MASGFGLRHALPATRARVVPQARTVLTRATIAEPVVVKREGASRAMRPALIHLARGERAVRENRKRDAENAKSAAPRRVKSSPTLTAPLVITSTRV
jgi:hypothetical protein